MKKTIIVTHAAPTFGFGVDEENYEQVYIPASLMKRSQLEVDDIIDVLVRPNDNERSAEVKWFAFFIVDDLIDEDDEPEIEPETQPEPEPLDMMKEIYQTVCELDGVATTNMIADLTSLRINREIIGASISAYLSQLHQHGKVARAAINQTPSDHRAVFALWAKDVATFRKFINEANNG